MENYKNAIIELCIEQELLLAKIYRLLAERFPQHAPFWSALAEEETEHAGWVKHLQELAKKDAIDFDEGKTRSYTVRTFIDYLRDVERQISRRELTVDRALMITLDMERSLIERNAYSRFRASAPQMQSILSVLQKGMDDHIGKVEEYVIKHKFPPRPK